MEQMITVHSFNMQIVAITMLALVLAEDSHAKKEKYNEVVAALQQLPTVVAKVTS